MDEIHVSLFGPRVDNTVILKCPCILSQGQKAVNVFLYEEDIIPFLEITELKPSYFINMYKLIQLVSW